MCLYLTYMTRYTYDSLYFCYFEVNHCLHFVAHNVYEDLYKLNEQIIRGPENILAPLLSLFFYIIYWSPFTRTLICS